MRYGVVAVSLVLWASTSWADWPQMRGPGGQGHSDAKELPTTWSKTENIAWKSDIPGKGWSTPTVVGNLIYLTTAVPQGDGPKADQSLEIVKLDSATGKLLKQQRLFLQNGQTAPPIHSKNSHASPTPVHENGLIYVHFGHMGTACVKAEDLSIVWSTQQIKYLPQHGNGGSPLVYRDKVYISVDGTDRRSLVALNKTNGERVWETKRSRPGKPAFSFGTPIVVDISGAPHVVATSSDGIYGYDPQSGQELWFLEYTGYSVVPVPVLGHGLIYFSTGYNTPSLLAIKVEKSGDKFEAKVAWRNRVDVPHNPSPVLIGDELYMVSDRGFLTCLDAKTGQSHWRERVPGGYSASLLYGGGHLYVLNEEGVCTVVKPGKEFQLVSKNELGGRTLASLGVDGESLLLRTDSSLYKIKK